MYITDTESMELKIRPGILSGDKNYLRHLKGGEALSHITTEILPRIHCRLLKRLSSEFQV